MEQQHKTQKPKATFAYKGLFAGAFLVLISLLVILYLPENTPTPQNVTPVKEPSETAQVTLAPADPAMLEVASQFGHIPRVNPNVLLDMEFKEMADGRIELTIQTREGNKQDISWEHCKMTTLEGYKLAQEIGKENGYPADIWMSLIASESGFHQWVPGPNGECTVNNSGIAWGIGQIYLDVHPEVDKTKALKDPEYNLREGAKIYKYFQGIYGDPEGRAVSGYKGEEGKTGGTCWTIWNKTHKAGGFTDLQSGYYLDWSYTPVDEQIADQK